MPTFQVRNKRTKIVLGEVTVADPEDVLDGLKDATGSSIEEIAHSLGSTIEEAVASVDIVEVKVPKQEKRPRKPEFAPLPRRRLFA